MEFGSSE